MAHPIVEEAQREDASEGHLPQVGLGANERDNRQKEEEKVTLPLGNTDVHGREGTKRGQACINACNRGGINN